MKRAFLFIILLSLCVFAAFRMRHDETIVTFDEPIDALSVGVSSLPVDLTVSAWAHDRWESPVRFEVDEEADPRYPESNLVMLPKGVTRVRFTGTTHDFVIHPIRISSEPSHYAIAARVPVSTPKILTRDEWGADPTYLFQNPLSVPVVNPDQQTEQVSSAPVSERAQECNEHVAEYPQEFKVTKTISKEGGKTYRWPLQYSKDEKLLVVHHTAIANGDGRSGVERMRALYAYHANNNGWGDIGYHYVIDDAGQIYEGKAGGKYVVGGHAYCNNIGTIGISLMGNFEDEEPTQEQLKALQWLLADLSDIYGIDGNRSVTFHGERFSSPVIGHRDLLSTSCPGYYVYNSLDQIRQHVISGDVNASITLPPPPSSSSSRSKAIFRQPATTPGLSVAGSLNLSGNPLGKQRITLRYTAPAAGLDVRGKIATVSRSDNRIGIWQEFSGAPKRVTSSLILGKRLNGGTTVTIPLLIQTPETPGTYRIDIGTYRFILTVQGRRARDTSSSSSYSSVWTQPFIPRSSSSTVNAQESLIRIQLAFAGSNPSLNISGKTAPVTKRGDRCSLSLGSSVYEQSILRFSEEEFGIVGISNGKETRTYHGTVECRIVNDKIVLINELPLDTYMDGLAEEPDTEPYEKQRAFAIAARTYALYYMQASGTNRKFPGMPFDGSDDPAVFQLYKGIVAEKANPRWMKAVTSTAHLVLTKDGTVIKPPYFSSDDGRTRSPAEVGWRTFPFAEVFSSKPDPWCKGMPLRGHGVGMSGCGAEGQANEGKMGEEILEYYYPGTELQFL